MKISPLALLGLAISFGTTPLQSSEPPTKSGNPVFPGWYADPEGVVFDDRIWIYPTFSAPYDQQVFFDAFSSPDLVTWTKHSRILDTGSVTWAKRALWAPSIIEKDGRCFLFFGANDIQSEKESGGIGVAVADCPEGPSKRIGNILQQEPQVATGAGHHSVIQLPGQDAYHIVYHRRPLGEQDSNHRVTCIDRMEFDAQGLIKPVIITFEGVERVILGNQPAKNDSP